MSTLVKKQYTTKEIVNMVVVAFLMFGFGYIIPPFATVTEMGMRILGIFLGLVYGYTVWSIVPVSIMGIVAFGICGFNASFNATIAATMGSSTVFQSMMLFFTSGAIAYYGFGKWFVRWSLSKEVFHKNPMLYTWFFFFFSIWAGFMVGQTAMILLLMPIWMDIANTCGYSNDKDNFIYYGFGGIFLALVTSGGMLTYKSWLLGLANTWAELVGQPINLALQFAINSILTIIVVTVYCIVGAKLFKIDFSHVSAFDVEKMGDDCKVMRPRLKRILFFYAIAVSLAICGSIPALTKLAFFKFISSTVTMSGVYALCSVILFILPSGENDGETCIPFNTVGKTLVNWPVIMMLAIVTPVATALTNEATGILPVMSSIFSPVFDGRSGVILVIFTVVVMQILTNVGSNMAFGAAMIPIVGPFAVASGLNLTIMGSAIIYVTNVGIVLPGASAPAALFHSLPEIPDAKRRMQVCGFGALCVVVCCILVYSPIALFFG